MYRMFRKWKEEGFYFVLFCFALTVFIFGASTEAIFFVLLETQAGDYRCEQPARTEPRSTRSSAYGGPRLSPHVMIVEGRREREKGLSLKRFVNQAFTTASSRMRNNLQSNLCTIRVKNG